MSKERIKIDMNSWPESIPDELNLPCALCKQRVVFDYRVTDESWNLIVPIEFRRGVVCLSCFNKLAKKDNIELHDCLIDIFFADGLGETIHLSPIKFYIYEVQITRNLNKDMK